VLFFYTFTSIKYQLNQWPGEKHQSITQSYKSYLSQSAHLFHQPVSRFDSPVMVIVTELRDDPVHLNGHRLVV